MKYRIIGDTELSVSEIGFGAWTIGDDWWGHIDDDSATALLRSAFDLGINFFDTADGYGDGRSESLIGAALGSNRDEIVLATKFGYDKGDSGVDRARHQERPQNFSPPFIRDSLEDSLRRLGTDYVDLYQLHNPKMDALTRDDTFACLDDLQQAGKIRHYGVALGPRIGWRDEGARAIETRSIATIHMIFNLLEQVPGKELIELGQNRGVAALVRVPLSSGMLAGTYTSETSFGASQHRSHRDQSWLDDGLAAVEKLRFLELDGARPLTTAALKFVLSFDSVASVFPTITNSSELIEFASAPDVPDLTADELARIDEIAAQPTVSVN